MKNCCYSESSVVTDAVVDFCSVPRSREEIISFVGKSRNIVMRQVVAPLVASGNLKMTIPDKPKSANQKFVKP